MMNELLLIADESNRGYFPFSLPRSFVNGGADVYTAERADFAAELSLVGDMLLMFISVFFRV